MNQKDIETRTKNILYRAGATEETLSNEDEIEKFITAYIIEHGYGFGGCRVRGFGNACANYLFSKAPDRLFIIGDKVFTQKGLEHIKRLTAIKCEQEELNSKDKSGWCLTKILPPANDGWYIVLCVDKEYVDEMHYRQNEYVTCDKYTNNHFSLNVIAWRKLPEIDTNYMYELMHRNDALNNKEEE